MTKLLVIIAGPTASGKTRLAIDLALHFKTEIVSADSRQFFREISVGTAKPSESELREVPHHFINSHSVTDKFTAGAYGEAALIVLDRLFLEHDVVIMAGGSGLYIDAVIHGIDDLPKADETIRNELRNIFETSGLQALQELLKQADPASYQQIDIGNPRRIIRALEVTRSTGQPYSSLLGKRVNKLPWNVMMVGIELSREELYKRINERTAEMIGKGLKDEVTSVLKYRHENALSTVGYKEIFRHIDGEISLDEAALLIARHTRNYAKRQLTWFRKYHDMIWIKSGEENNLVDTIEKRLRGTGQ